MKTLLVCVLALAAFVPGATAQTTTSFTGKWEGTFTRQRPDGTENTQPILFNLTQDANGLAGTVTGPGDNQLEVSKGAVNAGTATFEVQAPNGLVSKFTLTIVKGRLQGEMAGERDGVVRGKAKVDAAKAAAAKAK